MLNLELKNMESKSSIGNDLKQNIINEISTRLLSSEHVLILAVSTVVDRRFQNINFKDSIACSKANRYMKEILTTTPELVLTEKGKDRRRVPDQTEEFNLGSEHYKIVQKKNFTPSHGEHNMPFELSYFLKNPVADLKIRSSPKFGTM